MKRIIPYRDPATPPPPAQQRMSPAQVIRAGVLIGVISLLPLPVAWLLGRGLASNVLAVVGIIGIIVGLNIALCHTQIVMSAFNQIEMSAWWYQADGEKSGFDESGRARCARSDGGGA